MGATCEEEIVSQTYQSRPPSAGWVPRKAPNMLLEVYCCRQTAACTVRMCNEQRSHGYASVLVVARLRCNGMRSDFLVVETCQGESELGERKAAQVSPELYT